MIKLVEIAIDHSTSIRRIDAFSKVEKRNIYIFYIFTEFLILASFLYGPPFYHVETTSFSNENSIDLTKQININIENFTFLNDFLTLDAIFIRNSNTDKEKVEIDGSLVIKGQKNDRSEILLSDFSSHYSILFPKSSSFSNKLKLYKRKIVDFNSINVELVLKYPKNFHENFSGFLIFTYRDCCHVLIDELLRIIFFFVSIFCFVVFLHIDKQKTQTPIQLKLLQFDFFILMICSNPFYFLSYFTPSSILSVLDFIFDVVFVTSIVITIVIVLDFSNITNITAQWFLIESFPFVLTGLIVLINVLLWFIDYSSSILNFLGLVMISISTVVVVYSFVMFKPKISMEKPLLISLTIITVFCCCCFEYYDSFKFSIANGYNIQIFTFSSLAGFLLMIAYLFYPVRAELCDDDEKSFDIPKLNQSM